MDVLLYIIAGPLFLVSIAAHILVRIRMKPKYDGDLDDYYYEFEDQHPEYAKYTKWSNLTFAAATVAVLLLLLALIL
ncbi:MAG: hypothetical protein JSU70_04325 [Phycisphaerales bacterium]|nr:MAG: hypothetical protein JSU70_04325 [Phycisphaerales bacterium]